VIALTIFSRPGCHLCEDMKAVVARVARSTPLSLEEIDISADPALEAQYGLEIPVLLIGGKKVAKYRIAEGELRRLLLARLEGQQDGQEGQKGQERQEG
jgi:glutaredoxin